MEKFFGTVQVVVVFTVQYDGFLEVYISSFLLFSNDIYCNILETRCYFFNFPTVTWSSARQKCQSLHSADVR